MILVVPSKCVLLESGEECVIWSGMKWMPWWPADNLDTLNWVSSTCMGNT